MLTVKRVCIGWRTLKKATKYAVYRSEKANKGYELLFVTKRNYITNGKLARNQYYYYKVQAYSGSKKYGKVSSSIQIYTGTGYAGIRSATRISYKKAKIVWNEEQFAHGYQDSSFFQEYVGSAPEQPAEYDNDETDGMNASVSYASSHTDDQFAPQRP